MPYSNRGSRANRRGMEMSIKHSVHACTFLRVKNTTDCMTPLRFLWEGGKSLGRSTMGWLAARDRQIVRRTMFK